MTLGKGKIWEIFHGVRIFLENRGKSETGGKCIIASGEMDAPVCMDLVAGGRPLPTELRAT